MDVAFHAKFASVVWLDIILSGDNALVIGIAAAALPKRLQRQAIVYGLVLATAVRVAFATAATFLLTVPGLLFAGGAALLWVAYRLLRELMIRSEEAHRSGSKPGWRVSGSLLGALMAITIADISMSIDNVIAVAAIARDNVKILVFGLTLSIALMGVGASLILRVMNRYRWISYAGVALLVLIGGEMIYEGWPGVIALLPAGLRAA